MKVNDVLNLENVDPENSEVDLTAAVDGEAEEVTAEESDDPEAS